MGIKLVLLLLFAVMLKVWLTMARRLGAAEGQSVTETSLEAVRVELLSEGEVPRFDRGRKVTKPTAVVGVELTAQPSSVQPGIPVRLEATTRNLRWWIPYSLCYATNGGRITRPDGGREVYVETFGLKPGVYEVKVHMLSGFNAGDRATGYASFQVV